MHISNIYIVNNILCTVEDVWQIQQWWHEHLWAESFLRWNLLYCQGDKPLMGREMFRVCTETKHMTDHYVCSLHIHILVGSWWGKFTHAGLNINRFVLILALKLVKCKLMLLLRKLCCWKMMFQEALFSVADDDDDDDDWDPHRRRRRWWRTPICSERKQKQTR